MMEDEFERVVVVVGTWVLNLAVILLYVVDCHTFTWVFRALAISLKLSEYTLASFTHKTP